MANKLGGPQKNEQYNVIFHPPLCIDVMLLMAPAAHSAPNKMKMSPLKPEGDDANMSEPSSGERSSCAATLSFRRHNHP